jgi:hypothetical protein
MMQVIEVILNLTVTAVGTAHVMHAMVTVTAHAVTAMLETIH